jgi:SAM-dependent methyltransferase
MFFDDAPAAFRNLAGWLAPGGRFAFAVWGRPADNPWVTTVRDVVAEFVDVPPPDPDAPGPFRYGQADTLLKLLRQAGFGEVEVSEWREGLAIGGGLAAADAADFALAAFSIAEPLAKTDDVVRGNAHRALTERFSRARASSRCCWERGSHEASGLTAGCTPTSAERRCTYRIPARRNR